MIITVIIAAAFIGLAVLLYPGRGRTRSGGGQGLKRRFGPEYARAVADHDGDTRAAEQELGKRVKEHGLLTQQPLTPAARERYMTRWAAVQEQFVASPQQGVIEADALLGRLARDRGFPDGERFEDQIAALSVHHAHYVQGYRSMHTVAHEPSGTEDMREVMADARSLFEALVTEQPVSPPRPSAPTAEAKRRGQ
ncbi:hypothetical protein OG806_44665 [Streptomyces sp. NBC_00882]|uniref:hypothetical protein n=1 Tax=Streptomyces TaxID=1883 RepID=UPI003863DD60|nr:hypothetical protein OG806_44665 [Streptomyces sp. NBC_00882]WSZ62942.1 hypothetical protein OH824_43540 [Streptomyces canus]